MSETLPKKPHEDPACTCDGCALHVKPFTIAFDAMAGATKVYGFEETDDLRLSDVIGNPIAPLDMVGAVAIDRGNGYHGWTRKSVAEAGGSSAMFTGLYKAFDGHLTFAGCLCEDGVFRGKRSTGEEIEVSRLPDELEDDFVRRVFAEVGWKVLR